MSIGRRGLLGAAGAGVFGTTLWAASSSAAVALKGGTLRVAILAGHHQFRSAAVLVGQLPVIKNLYDSLIEYTPEGKAIPSLATEWKIAPDNKSVTSRFART